MKELSKELDKVTAGYDIAVVWYGMVKQLTVELDSAILSIIPTLPFKMHEFHKYYIKH